MLSIADADFGDLVWNPELEWWEGSVKLDTPQPFVLYIFSRDEPDRRIADDARNAFRRVAAMEAPVRESNLRKAPANPIRSLTAWRLLALDVA